VQADREVALAEVGLTRQAPEARSAGDSGAADHPIPGGEAVSVLAEMLHYANELVTQDQRTDVPADWMRMMQGHEHRPVSEFGAVRSADRGAENAQLQLALAGSRRPRDRLNPHVAWTVEYRSAHLARGHARAPGTAAVRNRVYAVAATSRNAPGSQYCHS
jgi:hypothetical protein